MEYSRRLSQLKCSLEADDGIGILSGSMPGGSGKNLYSGNFSGSYKAGAGGSGFNSFRGKAKNAYSEIISKSVGIFYDGLKGLNHKNNSPSRKEWEDSQVMMITGRNSPEAKRTVKGYWNPGFFEDVIVKRGAKILELLLLSTLQKNTYTDTITNFMAPAGGEIDAGHCREWVFAKYPDGRYGLIATRNYSKKDGELPLSNVNEINFDNQGAVTKYASGKIGNHPLKSPAFPDQYAEMTGLLGGLTGGTVPYRQGDVNKYHKYIRDITVIRDRAGRVSYRYFADPSKHSPLSGGPDPFNRQLYTINLPVSDSPFHLFDPTQIDLGLSLEHLKVGEVNKILGVLGGDLLFRILISAGENIDPGLEMKMETAYELVEKYGIGNLALAFYPVDLALSLGKKWFYDGSLWKFSDGNLQS